MHENDSPDRVPIPVIPRRRFLRDSALLTGGAVAGLAAPAGVDASGAVSQRFAAWARLRASSIQDDLESYAPVALTADELVTLKAAIARIIPNDDLGPGAVEAGVFVYIDRSLAGRNAATLPVYQAGLAALEKAAGSGGFAALTTAEQDELLAQAEAATLVDAPEGFFALLLEHTRQGMFGDPVHGGNKDFAGWDLIGFPGIKLVWSAADQAIGAEVAPEHISVAEYGGDAS